MADCLSCHTPMPGRRRQTKYCSSTCRARASRARRPAPADHGPLLITLIHRYQNHLAANATGVSTVRTFDRIARTLVAFNTRAALSISKEEWASWFASKTADMAPSTRALWWRTVSTFLGETPHWFKVAVQPVPVSAKSPLPALSRRRLAALCTAPRTQRTRLVMELLTAGFIPSEITRLRIAPEGDVRLEHPAWGRRKVPRIPDTLQARLRAFAGSRGLAPGARPFPVTTQAIRGVVKAAQHQNNIALSPTALARSARPCRKPTKS